MDLPRARVVHVADGKGKASVFSFKERYEKKEGITDDIETVVMDLSPAFIAAVEEAFTKATIVFDKFHVLSTWNDQGGPDNPDTSERHHGLFYLPRDQRSYGREQFPS